MKDTRGISSQGFQRLAQWHGDKWNSDFKKTERDTFVEDIEEILDNYRNIQRPVQEINYSGLEAALEHLHELERTERDDWGYGIDDWSNENIKDAQDEVIQQYEQIADALESSIEESETGIFNPPSR